jgi:phage tail-like protein
MRRQAIERLLPAMYQRAATPGGVLSALLDVMEVMHAPSEATLAAVDDLVAPYRTRDDLVPFLIGWVALDHIAPSGRSQPIPIGRLRNLVATSAEIAAWRGTAHGLRTVLQTATGVAGFVVEEPADRPFHLVVRVPAEAVDQIDLVRRLVLAEKPAATTCAVIPAGGEE